MELLLYAALFTLWQCTASLSPQATAIASFGGRGVAWPGPGYRLFSPWPGDLALVLEGVPFDGEGRAEPAGAPLREIARAFSVAEFRAELASVRRETRLLRRACELYLLAVFAALPATVWRLGEEAGWLFALPGIAALHAAALAALHLAERRAPAPRRLERFLGSALFPPALLRTPVDLVAARLAGFHPATAAAALLGAGAFVRELRREIGRLGARPAPAAAAPADEIARGRSRARLRDALLSLCEQRGLDRGEVLVPRRIDGTAQSYCPLCLDEFLVRSGRCGGCGAASVGYE